MAAPVDNSTLIKEIHIGHEDFSSEACKTAVLTYSAAILILGALIVITCASFCLSIHGVRLIEDVVIPAYIPAGVALIVSIPLVIASVQNAEEHNTIFREEVLNKAVRVLESKEVEVLAAEEKKRAEKEKEDENITEAMGETVDKDEKERIKNYVSHYIVDNLIPPNTSKVYKQKFLSELKARVPEEEKDQTPDQKEFVKVCDDALQIIMKKQPKMKEAFDQIQSFAAAGKITGITSNEVKEAIANGLLERRKEYYDERRCEWIYFIRRLTTAGKTLRLQVALKCNRIEVQKIIE